MEQLRTTQDMALVATLSCREVNIHEVRSPIPDHFPVGTLEVGPEVGVAVAPGEDPAEVPELEAAGVDRGLLESTRRTDAM